MANRAVAAAGPVIETFTPLSGRVLGYLAVGAGLLLALASVSDPIANQGAILVGVILSLIAWVVLIRPLVVAHTNGVVLRNMVSDTFIPWSSIEKALVLQTLRVVTPTKVYHGLGVSRSARSIVKESRPGHATPGFFGMGGSGALGRSDSPAVDPHAGGTYQAYVESRLHDLAAAPPKGSPSGTSTQPVVSWAVLPLVAVAVAALCAGLLLL